MSKVLVIELPDNTVLAEAMHVVQLAIGPAVEGSRVYAAVREDAATILRVFGVTFIPDPQETP